VSGPPEVVFYYRDGCHLCEEMAAFLFRHWPEVAGAMVWRDVDADPTAAARYGDQVPVLERGAEVVCRYAVEPAALVRYFGEPVNPV
jgi:hypothetical protein